MGNSLPTVSLGAGRSAKTLSLGWLHSCALLDNNLVKCWGANHGCALLDNDTLKCWGFNMSGQLGLGDTSGRGSAGGQMGDSLPAVDVDLN